VANVYTVQPLPASIADRRRDVRRQVSGDVWLAPEGSRPALVRAALLETSAAGFRATHESELLPAGTLVRFRHAQGRGLARVAWNTQRSRSREAGFLIISGSS
jgi:hypothetical protein